MCRPCRWLWRTLVGLPHPPINIDLGLLHLAILFRREMAKANDEEFREKVAAFDQRDALREEYEQAKLECHRQRAARRELEMRLMRHGIPLPEDGDEE